MVLTRIQLSIIKNKDKEKNQSNITTRNRPFTRNGEKLPTNFSVRSINRSRSSISKRILNDTIACIRTPSCDSRSRSSSSSSFSSSSSRSSSSSSYSSAVELSPPSSESPKSLKTLTIADNTIEFQIDKINIPSLSINISSSVDLNRFVEDGIITVYKSSRSGDFLCLHGYTYQIDREMVDKIKWKCKQSRCEKKCKTKIYTTKNLGTDEASAYRYLESNGIEHSHDANYDEQKVSRFISHFKEIGKHHRTVPPSKIVNELATTMKLTDEQLGMIPRYGTLCKRIH